MSALVETPYGPCDRRVLERLRQEFDTTQLLQAVDDLDTIRASLSDPQALRFDLLELHAMAHTVINGAGMTVAPHSKRLTEAADDLETALDEIVGRLSAIREQVHLLCQLAPSGDGD